MGGQSVSPTAHPNVFAWSRLIEAFGEDVRNSWPAEDQAAAKGGKGQKGGRKEGKNAPKKDEGQ